MAEASVRHAKTHLSKLLARVAAGEQIIITKAGKPVARLVPYHGPRGKRVPGLDRGQIWIADDFDAPLAPEMQKLFE